MLRDECAVSLNEGVDAVPEAVGQLAELEWQCPAVGPKPHKRSRQLRGHFTDLEVGIRTIFKRVLAVVGPTLGRECGGCRRGMLRDAQMLVHSVTLVGPVVTRKRKALID